MVKERREITLHKTDHPLNTYRALSLQYARAMDKNKCWVCSHLPHSSKHGLPLFAVPLQGEDMCGYLVRRQDRPTLTKVEKASVKERIAEIRSNWEEGGYNCTNYDYWYYPKYRSIGQKATVQGPAKAIKITNYEGLKKGEGLEKYPPHFQLMHKQIGLICLVRRQGTGPHLGESTCRHYARHGNETVTIEGRINGTTIPVKIEANNLVEPQAPLNGTYFVCGYKAYSWLPVGWTGSCYLGFVLPRIRITDQSPFMPQTRSKRGISAVERFFMIAFPLYGAGKSAREIINLAASLEKLANTTSEDSTKQVPSW